jgi:hypothetical protein
VALPEQGPLARVAGSSKTRRHAIGVYLRTDTRSYVVN